MDLTFRTLGAWGAGKGANLEAVEVDNNFWNLAQAIFDLQNNPAMPNGIAAITVSGTQMTITLHDGTVMGPYTLPVLTFRWRGDWQPLTSYAVLDVFTVPNTGIYMVQVAHTTGETFDPNLQVGTPPAAAYLQLFGSTDASLSGLSDVQITSLQNHDFLQWVAADSKWENVALGTMAYQNATGVAITGGSITGLPNPVNPADAVTKAYADSLPLGGTSADGTMMSNISGATAAAAPNTLSAYLDHVLATTTRGSVIFRGAAGWVALLPGSAGTFLQTGGSGADPSWQIGASGVTSITAGAGISTGGAPITATGTISLAQIGDANLLGNNAGATAAPVGLTLTQFLDHAIGSSRGTVLTRNVTGWIALAPGPSGQYLQSAGAGADLLWSSPLGAGTVTSVAAGTGLTTGSGSPITAAGTILFAQVPNGTLLANISGATAAPTPSTLSLILDGILSSTQGSVIYRGASAWSALAPGTSGQVLTSGGAAANPSWAASAGVAPVGPSQLLANLTASSAVPVGQSLSNILDYVIASARGTLLYRSASAWVGLPPGTTGYVLSTGGPTGDPSWIAGPTGGAVGTGNLIARRVFTANATYTPTTGTSSVIVTVVSGGGAGGGVQATTAAQQAEGSGGGSGGVVQSTITTGFSGAAIVVGAGGTAASGANGGNGGASSFGTLTSGGGAGGPVGVAGINTGVLGGPGGTATGGTLLNIPGERGWLSSMTMNGGSACSGRGASTPMGFGCGGEEQIGSGPGVAGYGYGSGGSGAINAASQAAAAGGNGAPGVVIVDEYGALGATPPVLSSSVAAAGVDQASATALTTQISFVSGATGTNAVVIGTGLMTAGNQIMVANESTTNSLILYPPAGATINAEAINQPMSGGIPPNTTATFVIKSTTALRSVP